MGGAAFESVDLQVREQERLRVGGARKADAREAAYGAVYAVAADDEALPRVSGSPSP